MISLHNTRKELDIDRQVFNIYHLSQNFQHFQDSRLIAYETSFSKISYSKCFIAHQ